MATPKPLANFFAGARRWRLFACGLGAASALAVYSVMAANATFTVTSNADDDDADPGNGVCATAAGVCTLRAALTEAIDTSGFKTINFNLGACSASSTKSGLQGQYFNNTSLSGSAVLTRYEAVDFDWGSGSPAGAVNSDNFSVRWTGTLSIPTTGSYTFQTNSDDGARLYLNGSAVIDDWGDHSPTIDTSASKSYTAGQQVSVTLEYYENGGGANITLYWKKPGSSSYVAIPIGNLS